LLHRVCGAARLEDLLQRKPFRYRERFAPLREKNIPENVPGGRIGAMAEMMIIQSG
jgi:hypothetical protein